MHNANATAISLSVRTFLLSPNSLLSFLRHVHASLQLLRKRKSVMAFSVRYLCPCHRGIPYIPASSPIGFLCRCSLTISQLCALCSRCRCWKSIHRIVHRPKKCRWNWVSFTWNAYLIRWVPKEGPLNAKQGHTFVRCTGMNFIGELNAN